MFSTRLAHIITQMHSLGVQHGDLDLRNVVAKMGELRVIDFELSSIVHNCPLSGACDEIVSVQAL
jgi:tRNA A-37 threonylcarbamoyl transferase component Bud32